MGGHERSLRWSGSAFTLVAAAAGARIIKVGSAATASVMGSRELVQRLGISETSTAEEILAQVCRHGFAFVPVEGQIPMVERIYGGRFHVPNPFSFGLSAMTCPVRGDLLVYGLAHPRVDLAASVLQRLGVPHAVVVTSKVAQDCYLDEFGIGYESLVCEVQDGQVQKARSQKDADIPGAGTRITDLEPPPSQEEGVAWVTDVLAGRGPEEYVHLVALNAAWLTLLAGLQDDLRSAHLEAVDVIFSGRALRKLEELQSAPPFSAISLA